MRQDPMRQHRMRRHSKGRHSIPPSDFQSPIRQPGLDRREVLKAGALGLMAWSGAGRLQASPAAAAPACVLTPRQTAGPFYRDLDLMRSDLREDREGVPLRLELTVVDASTCQPIPGALVDVWHCDAAGIYSGFAQQAEDAHHGRQGTARRDSTFLRGLQSADGEGQVRFQTIFPGWYSGRVTHIHFMVHLGGRTAVTSQLYFPDEITGEIYQRSVYGGHGTGYPRLAEDGIFRHSKDVQALIVKVRPQDEGYAASHVLGVRL